MINNRLSRREFLTTLFAAVAAGTLLTSPAVADAIEQMPEDDKIVRAVRLAKHIVSTATLDTARNVKVADKKQMERLLALLVREFDNDYSAHKEVRLIIENPKQLGINLEVLDEAELYRLADSAVPIAILKSVICSRARFKVSDMEAAFRGFTDRYSTLILGSMDIQAA